MRVLPIEFWLKDEPNRVFWTHPFGITQCQPFIRYTKFLSARIFKDPLKGFIPRIVCLIFIYEDCISVLVNSFLHFFELSNSFNFARVKGFISTITNMFKQIIQVQSPTSFVGILPKIVVVYSEKHLLRGV